MLSALCAAVPIAKAANAAPIVFEGPIPAGELDYFFLDFDVPAGTREIEIRHDDLSETNILDFGLDDPKGYRGWGGGTSEPAIVSDVSASRAYVPGTMPPGKWRVVVGKAKVVASPARYRVEVDLRTAPTLAPVTRSAYVPPPPRKVGTRYYAGDLHVHSIESTDADATLEQNIALAKERGLEWIEISDHNTITQLDFFNAQHERHPDFLLLPGIEVTTYTGHANAIGATRFIDPKVGLPAITIDSVADAARAQGAVFSINHPVLEIGDMCIGCAWKHEIDPTKVGGVEIGTLGLEAGAELFSERAIAFWDALLDKGAKVPALGGSDDHRAGTSSGLFFLAKVGSPTTLVRATELSAEGILDGIKRGATVVKLDGPDDPMVELEFAASGELPAAYPGDTVVAGSRTLRAEVTKGVGQTLRLVKNGKPEAPVAVTSDPFVYELPIDAPADGADRWRAEVIVGERPRTVTSHLWLRRTPEVPPAASPGSAGDEGCGMAPTRQAWSPVGWILGLGTFAALRLTKRRRR